jgi:hypothetical protein
MTILQFQVGGKYDYSVTYETGTEEQKLQTNDKPTGNLLTAVSNVVNASIKFFRFENIAAKFRKVTFSYPDNSPDHFCLEFIIKTKENVFVEHGLKTAKLPLKTDDITSTDGDYQQRVNQNNSLIEKILKLREEIELYAQGARAQSELPFEDGSDEKELEGDLFDNDDEEDDALDIVAGNIGQDK